MTNPRTPARQALYAAAALMLCALALTALLGRSQARSRELCRARQRLLNSLQPDLDRLARYESVKTRLRQASPGPRPWDGLPAPTRREQRRLEALDGWQGVQTELGWDVLPAALALRLLNRIATNPFPRRVAAMQLEALDASGQVRLSLTIESVQALDDGFAELSD